MVSIQPVVDISIAVAAALSGAGLKTYQNAGPTDPEVQAPYVVVYAQPPMLDGPLGAPYDDAVTTVQVKSVSNGYGSAQRTMDAVRSAVLAGIALPPGRAVAGPIETAGGQPPILDPDSTTRLWMGDELYRIPTTPA